MRESDEELDARIRMLNEEAILANKKLKAAIRKQSDRQCGRASARGAMADPQRSEQRDLGLSLIDIGFKALAMKLHPDKGGSQKEMTRLSRVRDRLRGSA